MAQAYHLHLRLFLEGIEVPVVAASINIAANVPATATIQVIATDKVLDLLPRTLVHLFFYDYVGVGHTALDLQKEKKGGNYQDWFNSQYKLLFMGELVTIKFQKQHGSRAVILECADFSNYWDTTFQYNFGGSLFGGRRQAAFIGANSTFFTSPLGHGVGTVSRLLNGRSVNFPELRGLLAGVVRMLEAIGGSYYGRNTFRGANDFTSIAELRLKVLQQITAAEKDTSTAKLFARKAFSMWMNRATQGLGKLVSFRGLVKTCFQFIFHEVYPCPVARFVPAGTRKDPLRWSVSMDKTGRYQGFAAEIRAALEAARTAQEALQNWRLGVGAGEDVRALGARLVRTWRAADLRVRQLHALGMAKGPKAAQKTMAELMQNINKIKNLSVNSGGVISINWVVGGTRKGTIDRNYPQINTLWTKVIGNLERMLGIKIGKSASKTVPTVPRVNNQIFRPDVWFTSPPRCNVLFPESYDAFSWGRQYLREVSRMELQTHNEILGNDAFGSGRYYAPNVEDVRRGVKLSSRRFAKLIMDHELYTGIIPMQENMSEVNIQAMRAGMAKTKGAKVGYAQRAVNFQYFKYRFEARSMEASGRFNPMFVAGFPAVIIDKYLDVTQLAISSMKSAEAVKELELKAGEPLTRAEILRELVSPQYVGTCVSLSHNVAQEGGNTAYSFAQARVHRETTELLGVDKATVFKIVGEAAKTTPVAAPVILPPMEKQRGPRGGIITKVRNVSNSKKYKGKPLPLLGQGSKVIVGDWYPDWYFKGIYVDKGSQLLIGAYEVTEGYTRRKKDKVDLPMEEAIKPPWIWDGWSVPKVSETYGQLFGIGAVTDVEGFSMAPTSDPRDVTRYFVGQDDLQALQDQQKASASSKGKKSNSARISDARSKAIAEENKHANAVKLVTEEKTVENSIDFVVRAYSFVKAHNLDVGDFLRAYTWRPVATMVDILGGADLKIKKTVTKVKKSVKKKIVRKRWVVIPDVEGNLHKEYLKPDVSFRFVKTTVDKIGYEVEGKEGFHSRAFGDVEDLFGLVSPTVTSVLGLTGDKRKVAARLDVRKRRREVVRLYVAELTGSRGLIG
jgi:hypothetical protein